MEHWQHIINTSMIGTDKKNISKDELPAALLEPANIIFENEASGKETTIDRTRRLFYVTCSRAEESLAVVYYAADPVLAHDAMIRQGWFEAEEIELVGQ